MKNMTMYLVGLTALGAIGPEVAAASKVGARPNVLIILVDDAGYNDFGFMGTTDLLTPNIDALAHQGVVFDDAHVAATVSSPSRACLITGRYGHRFGYECNLSNRSDGLPPEEQTLGDVFKRGGYRTAAVGKWHLGSLPEMHPNCRGFDLFYGMLAGSRSYFYNAKGSDRPGAEQNLQRNGRQECFEGYLTDRFTDEAVRFIEEADQPFLLYLAYNAVHSPMQALPADLECFAGHRRQKLAAMTWALDRGVGRVMESLRRTGQLENTLIFFLSDNGGATTNQSNNYPLKGFKGNKFEGGHRVPFFVAWPGHIEGGRHYAGLSSSLDIFATAIDAAGVEPPRLPLDGVSLLPYLYGKKKGMPHQRLFWRKLDSRAVRDGYWKLVMTQGVDTVLYRLDTDLDEMRDLSGEHPEKCRELIRHLHDRENHCMKARWDEGKWGAITNHLHLLLMSNKIKTAKDLKGRKR